MLSNSYFEAVEWLFQQFPSYQSIGAKAYKPGLDNVYQLLAKFNNPQNDFKCIHVAGTNGKGSTCSMITAGLVESGYKVGLFTSPHILDFSERIRVNGQVVEQQFVVDFVNQIQQLKNCQRFSFFEITFAMAMCYFRQQKCDFAVVETGLGGRLDATNVIQPILSVITNISLDHTQFLGETLTEIAHEKAGIIKENTPVVISEYQQETAIVFDEVAKQKNAPIFWSKDVSFSPDVQFPLLGDYQLANYNTTLYALQIILKEDFNKQIIDKGISKIYEYTGFYGRLYRHPDVKNVIFDVSHNVDGIKKTLKYVKKHYDLQKLYVLYGTSSDKKIDEIFPLFSDLPHFSFTEFNHARSAKFEDIIQYLDFFEENITFFDDAMVALETLQKAINEEDVILVMGSFFLVADIFQNFIKKKDCRN